MSSSDFYTIVVSQNVPEISSISSIVGISDKADNEGDKNNDDDENNDDDGNFAKNPEFPSCREVMRTQKHFADGEFLTRMSHRWIPRFDGSQRVELDQCRLHRYGREEALQCLNGTHINFIGDSVSRYQYLSLAYFFEKGKYPHRFGGYQGCTHFNRKGEPICSPPNERNICAESDWRGAPKEVGGDSWVWMLGNLGGSIDGGPFSGRMECSCARLAGMKCAEGNPGDCTVENQLYASDAASPHGRVILSNIKEDGWGSNPRDLFGFNFTGCSFNATCRSPVKDFRERVRRAQAMDFDWKQGFSAALADGGILHRQLPPVDISFYNRGLWGTLTEQQSKERFPFLKNFTKSRCFYKTTTGSRRSAKIRPVEVSFVKSDTYAAGCEYFDVGHLTSEFAALDDKNPSSSERLSVYWDAVHFQPWVYEEINNILLNLLCNAK